MRIAICDDDKGQRKEFARLLGVWGKERGQVLDLGEYANAEAFLFSYADHPCSLLLLDIEMGQLSGMELARKLRARGDMLPIVFLTGYSDYMEEGYEVEALHYLLKPVSQEKLFAVLDRYAKRRAPEKELVVSDGESAVHLAAETILYCEAVGKKTHVHTREGGIFISSEGIGAFFGRLGADFVFCHRSYIVNLRHVRSIGRTEVKLEKGACVPLSRRQREEVNGRFVQYYTGGEVEHE